MNNPSELPEEGSPRLSVSPEFDHLRKSKTPRWIVGLLLASFVLSGYSIILSRQVKRANIKRASRADSTIKQLLHDTEDLVLIRIRLAITESQLENASIKRIDMTSTAFQDAGNGFKVAGLSLEQQFNGAKIKGEILNTTAVTHSEASFRIHLDKGDNTFTLYNMRPAHSRKFEVFSRKRKSRKSSARFN